jgi:lysophospholipase L1-like esterase
MRRRFAAVLVFAVLASLPFADAAAAGDHVWSDTYTALGDSYSSGVGTREYYDSACKQSFYAYPQLLFKNWPRRNPLGNPTSLGMSDVACGGATTKDLLDHQIYSIPPGANYVTLTIGGNDAGFSSVIKQCAKPWPFTCGGDIDKAQEFIRNTLPGRLQNVFSRIRQAAPFASVIVLGYPHLFMPKECNGAVRISIGEQKRLNQTGDILRDVTHYMTAAAGRGFYFVDAISFFKGHEICSGSKEWLNGLSDPPDESFHPNRTGHAKGYFPLAAFTIASTP